MKKQITTLFSLAATMLLALTFNSCGEEVDVIRMPQPTPTVFSTSDNDDATRTSLKNNANFFWEVGDKIWVYDDTRAWKSSEQSNITGTQQEKAKFVLNGTFTGNSYNVIYTGYTGTFNRDSANTSSVKVTIADQQTQTGWNNAQHLSTSGDCGTGTAYKQPGGYKFKLDHKASYLLLYPYLDTSLTGNYTLEKIEVYSDLSASYIAGEFDFTFDNGLADLPLTGTGKQEITLNCGTSGFLLDRVVPDATNFTSPSNHCFVVIAPGTHQLTIIYHVKNASGTKLQFIEDVASTQYEPNGVYVTISKLQNNLTPAEYEYESVGGLRWGARTATDAASADTPLTYYPWNATPNYNELSWYILPGYIYWDNATRWVDRSTNTVKRGGVWLRKWEFIPGFSSTTLSGVHPGRRVVLKGRPEVAELHTKWFFLPAFDGDMNTIYYLSYAVPNSSYAWSLSISNGGIATVVAGKVGVYRHHINIYKDGVQLNNQAPWNTSPWYKPS